MACLVAAGDGVSRDCHSQERVVIRCVISTVAWDRKKAERNCVAVIYWPAKGCEVEGGAGALPGAKFSVPIWSLVDQCVAPDAGAPLLPF